MKRGFLFLLSSVFALVANSQTCTSERYLSNIFQSSVSQDVVFGNSPALTTVYVAENVTVNQQMTMDVFFPVGDALAKRPAVILAYGGGYLVGSKEDEDVWATCDSLAKKGYVTASINYRMNMNVADPASAVRAIYRAAQDYHSAIRHIKEYSNTYGIDTNYIFVGGVSAGGFSAMHAVFMDESERPAETYQSGLGGINPDLGCLACAGNSYNHTANVRGIINLWGALLDTNYIQQEELVPMTLFHGTNDAIVPYDHGFPFTALFLMPEVYGSFNVAARVNHLGGNAELNTFQGVGHNIWGVNVNNQLVGGPTEYWVPITDSIISFLYENIRPEPVVISPFNVCQDDTTQLIASNVPANGRVCWTVQGGLVIDANADSSELTVVWNYPGVYEVSAVAINHLDAYSVPTSVQVEVVANPWVSITQNGGVLEASPGYASYQWYLNGNPIVGADQSQYVPTSSGTFMVQSFTAEGCSSFSEPLVMVGIEELPLPKGMVKEIRVYDLQGRLLGVFASEKELINRYWNGQQLLLLRYFDQDMNVIREEKRNITPSF
ncbi:MAG: alpha/beta hydrolase fold domain-containing protein [Flavobacteriales bacterium]|nr:alpha/beta hydrolase fold domain-containing protein [Flavobacteriales bacterium]